MVELGLSKNFTALLRKKIMLFSEVTIYNFYLVIDRQMLNNSYNYLTVV